MKYRPLILHTREQRDWLRKQIDQVRRQQIQRARPDQQPPARRAYWRAYHQRRKQQREAA